MKSLDFTCPFVENHTAYRNVLMDLHERGFEEPLLFIADGLPGVEEEIKQLYPRTDFRLCTVHASRNFDSRPGCGIAMRLIQT